MPKRTQALTEEDLLTDLAEKVHVLTNTYVENNEDLTLLVSQTELQGLAADFVTKAVEYASGQEELLSKVEWAVKKWRRTGSRQWAVQVANAAHNYAWSFYADSDDPNIDELIDAKTNEVIVEQGVDLDELNALIDSIY